MVKNENTLFNKLENMDDHKNDNDNDNDQFDHLKSIRQLFNEIILSPELIVHPPITSTITILTAELISNSSRIKKLFTKFTNDYDIVIPKEADDKIDSTRVKQYNEFMNIFALKYCNSFEPLIPSNIVLIKHFLIIIKKENAVDEIKDMLTDYIGAIAENNTSIDTPPSISNLKASDYLKKIFTKLFNKHNWVEFRNTMYDLFIYHHENKLQIWNIQNIELKNKCMTYYLNYGKAIPNDEIILIDKKLHENFSTISSWTINTIGNLAHAYVHNENKPIRLCAKKCIDFWRNVNE